MKKFAVIGLGNFGFFTAKALYEDGNEVIAIDFDKGRIQAIDTHCTEAIVLEATDRSAEVRTQTGRWHFPSEGGCPEGGFQPLLPFSTES